MSEAVWRGGKDRFPGPLFETEISLINTNENSVFFCWLLINFAFNCLKLFSSPTTPIYSKFAPKTLDDWNSIQLPPGDFFWHLVNIQQPFQVAYGILKEEIYNGSSFHHFCILLQLCIRYPWICMFKCFEKIPNVFSQMVVKTMVMNPMVGSNKKSPT